MKTTVYGVGVGPGDPSLLTVRAVEILQSCRTVMAPAPTAAVRASPSPSPARIFRRAVGSRPPTSR